MKSRMVDGVIGLKPSLHDGSFSHTHGSIHTFFSSGLGSKQASGLSALPKSMRRKRGDFIDRSMGGRVSGPG